MPKGVYKRKPHLCKKCGETRESEFYPHTRSKCKKCRCAETSAVQRGNKPLHRRRHLRRTYGINPEDYDALLEKQNGLCALCGKPPVDDDLQKILVVDHDHVTGSIRGLIHGRCNSLLGYAREDKTVLFAAADYLSRHEP